MNTGDTAFMLISAALVLFMTPGLAFFYGGLVRRKNVLNTMMSSFFIIGLASAMWVLIGYTLSFGGNTFGVCLGRGRVLFRHHFYGGLHHAICRLRQGDDFGCHADCGHLAFL